MKKFLSISTFLYPEIKFNVGNVEEAAEYAMRALYVYTLVSKEVNEGRTLKAMPWWKWRCTWERNLRIRLFDIV